MKILVLVKAVPDTYGDRKLSLETGLADRGATDTVLDEIGERALEVALSYADAHAGTDVVALSMGPAASEATIRKALAMGATEAVHIVDDGLIGADLGLTAEVLAAAITRTGYDLVITGNISTDGYGGVMAAMLAELLQVPQVSALSSVEIGDEKILGTRSTEAGTFSVEAPLPAVISVTERMPDARFASFKNIVAAKKKPYATLTLADLGVDSADESAARSIVVAVAPRTARQAGTKIIDDGTAAEKLADYLAQNRLV
jgi:electron transfer flavoprotein beta subunit